MYIYVYGSDQVSVMHPPPPKKKIIKNNNNNNNNKKIINLGKKTKKENLREKICNLFRACLYFEEDILNQNH